MGFRKQTATLLLIKHNPIYILFKKCNTDKEDMVTVRHI
jgi:hypothetical protein